MNKVITIGKESIFPSFEFSINFKLDKEIDSIYLSIIHEIYENEFDNEYVSDLMQLMYIDKNSNNLSFNLKKHLIFLNKELEQSLNSIFSKNEKYKLFSKEYDFNYSSSSTFYLIKDRNTDEDVKEYFFDILDKKNGDLKINLEVEFSKSTLKLLKEMWNLISNFYK